MIAPSGDITDPHILNAILCLAGALLAAFVLWGMINVLPKDQRREPPRDLPRFPPF